MSLEIYKRGKIWHYRGTVAKRRLRGSTGTSDKAIAQRVAAETEAAEWRRHLDGPGAHVTFAQASIAYRDAGKCERFLERIEDYWKDTRLSDVSAGAVRQSAKTLYPNASGATRNRQVIVPTQAVINHAAELEWCAMMRVKRFPVSSKTKEPVDRTWATAFADQAVSDRLYHLAALCLFMFGTGARRGEACALRWADVDLSANKATIRQTKVEDTRIANLPPAVVAALANIPSNRNPDDLVFQYVNGESVGKVWGNVAKRAEIRHLTPHSCRHGFATTLLREGVDPKTVAYLGGWKDVATVMKFYAHAKTDLTVTGLLFDTNLAQAETDDPLTIQDKRTISQ